MSNTQMESLKIQNTNLDNGSKKSSPPRDAEDTLASSHNPEAFEDLPISEFVTHFVEEDLKLQQESDEGQEGLITREKLIPIIEDAKQKGIPYELLSMLWSILDNDPEIGDPPMVRDDYDLTAVLRDCWKKDLYHETINDLLFDLEGEENEEKFFKPQPQSEIDNPQNLYQLVRMAWESDRMEELMAMIEEYENEVYGIAIEEAIREHKEWIDERLARSKKSECAD